MPELPTGRPDRGLPRVAQAPPDRLVYCSGGFFGVSSTLEWDGQRLWRMEQTPEIPFDRPEDWVALASPESQAWADLAADLDRLKIWRWPTQSCNPLICDGSEWRLDISRAGKSWSGYDQNAAPRGFKTLERRLAALGTAEPIGGLPGPFLIRDGRAGKAWVFEWNGRRFRWHREDGRGSSAEQGEVPSPQPETWARFLEAFHLKDVFQISFQHGSYAGIEIKALPPRPADPDSDHGPGRYGFLDPIAAIKALRALIGRQ